MPGISATLPKNVDRRLREKGSVESLHSAIPRFSKAAEPIGRTVFYSEMKNHTPVLLARAIALLAAVSILSACASLAARPREAAFRLASAVDIDTIQQRVTLPLHRGYVGRRLVWYIVTESSDRVDARRRGVTWSPRLARLSGTGAVQAGSESDGVIHYSAGIDLSPTQAVTAAPDSGFPPVVANPGSIALAGYSPFVRFSDGVILNAPIVADEYEAIGRVTDLNPARGTVTLRMTRGYGDDRTLWYISTDASAPAVAAMESATYVPALAEAPGGSQGPGGRSARSGIVAVVNGVVPPDDPERQGLNSAMLTGLSALNVLQNLPDGTGRETAYSPVWDLHMARWSAKVVAAEQREKIFSWSQAEALRGRGSLSELGAAGVAINCSVMAIFVRR